MLSKPPAGVVYEALGIHEPDFAPRLLFGHAEQGEEAHQLGGDADACGAGSEEEDAVVGEREAGRGRRELGCVQEPAEHDGAGALNVVVEDGVFVAGSVRGT